MSPGTPVWVFLYSGFGEEVREQTDAKGLVTKFVRDALVRVTERVDAFGTGNAVTTTFTLDAPSCSCGTNEVPSIRRPGHRNGLAIG